MNKQQAKKRIEKLRKVINHHRYLYHVLDKQEISDSASDSLKHELFQLEKEFPEFIIPDSPTQRVGGKPLDSFKKIKHFVPMLSIEDIFSDKELKSWEDYLKRLESLQEFDFFTELKIDGFAVSLVYENGFLVYGVTRGNGRLGEDITQNLKTIESIPLKLEIQVNILNKIIEKKIKKLIKKGRIEIRGEVYMERKKFEKLNKELAVKGEKTYSNPRNLAAGSIRQLDPKLAASRPLDFLAYDIITDFGQKTHSEEHEILPVLGFKTEKGKKCKNLDEVMSFWKKVNKKRNSFPFQIDGIVITINNNSVFEKLGIVGKSPRAIRALKFSPEQATTKVLDIKVQVGRTGAITPVAVLKPITVGGVVVSRATLHNEDEIKRLGVKIGDTVIVGRAGDVIPDVILVLPDLRTGKEKGFRMPQKCSVCNTKLVKLKTEAIWRCPNPKCFARQKKYFYHFVSRNGFDIVGLGPKILNRLIDEGLVSDPADLFKLKQEDISPLERFAQKSAQNLIFAIQSKKSISLFNFIYALGIRNVGEQTAIDLAQHFNSLEKLKNVSLSVLEEIKDIGPIVAKSIYNFFQEKQNLNFIEKLERVGVKIKSQQPSVTLKARKLKGLSFVLTGSLGSMSREQVKARIRELGGQVLDSVSKQTDFVIMGKSPGSKLEKAKKLGVKTINENQFLKML